MENKTIEKIYEEHLKEEPVKYRKDFKKKYGVEMKTDSWIGWDIRGRDIESLTRISPEKRVLIMDYLKKGNNVGETAKKFKEDSNVVFALIAYNIKDYKMLGEGSV